MEEITAPETLEGFLAAKRIKEAAKKANQERSTANARRKLDSLITKKCQTIMIGSLARYEERFGYLWGHGKQVSELTAEEKAAQEVWDVVRTEVLNNGNNQIRAIKEEVARYSVNYEGYHIKLPIKSVTITGDKQEHVNE